MIRDYIANPLGYIRCGFTRKREKPLKDDILELYIRDNKSVDECAKYFNLNKRMFQKILSEYGIKKDRKKVYELQKETLLKSKGVENVFQLSDIKNKSKETCLKKYGKEHYTQTIDYKGKNLNTRKEKYGNDLYQREKYRKTCMEKYGVENYSYKHFNEYQMKFVNNKEYTINFIKDNDIQSALEFSIKSGIKLFASLTLLHRYDLMKNFSRFTSKEEKELQEFIQELGINFIEHYKMKNGKEIDIYIPTFKMGIEYNGDYWHSEIFRNEIYHLQKSLDAESEGIFIYHIFGYEWNTIKDKIKNQLKNILNANSFKIYARKCEIREVSNKDKKQFLEENHLQGNDHSLYCYGLYHNNELVSLMTFSKSYNTNKIEWELSRFCSKSDYNIVGGASKLFKHFVKTHNPHSIISYSNIAHARGKLYKILGFNNTHNLNPNYVWMGKNDIKTQYQVIVKNLNNNGLLRSEVEIMHNLGYYRIYDCGIKVWIWNNE